MKKFLLPLLFFALAKTKTFEVYVGEKFYVNLDYKTKTYEVRRVNSNIEIPADTLEMALSTALFGSYISNPLEREELVKDTLICEDLIKNYICYISFRVPIIVIKNLSKIKNFPENIRRETEEKIIKLLEEGKLEELIEEMINFPKKLQYLEEPFYEMAAELVGDPFLHFMIKGCKDAAALYQFSNSALNLNVYCYDLCKSLGEKLRKKRSEVRPLLGVIEKMREELKSKRDYAYELTLYLLKKNPSKVHEKMWKIIYNTETYNSYLKKVEEEKRKWFYLDISVSSRRWKKR